MVALFQEEHRAETDRSADIRATREAEVAAVEEAEAAAAAEAEADEAPIDTTPTRRQVITGGLSEGAEAAPQGEAG
jgi:hypothetical protein